LAHAAGFALATLTACGDGADVGLAEGDAHFVARFADARAPTGRLIGWNLGRGTYYAPERDARHPAWRTAERVQAAARLREIAAPGGPPPYVRFSGLQIDGTLGADGYHFWDFANPDRPPQPTDNMAVTDFATLSDEIGGELTVTLNFGSGTAAEAANYVKYLTGSDARDPFVAARMRAGRADPYDVKVFEIGNEVYGFWNTAFRADGAYSYANPEALNGGDPAWSGRPASDARHFAARSIEYVRAVQAVLPSARFRVPLSQATMDAWGGLESSLSALEPLLREPAVDAVVVHFYKADDALLTLGVEDVNAPEFMLSGSELFRGGFDTLRARLSELERERPLEVAITEYHVADAFSRGKFLLGDTAAVGLGLADMLVLFAQLGIEHACQHLSLAFGDTQDLLVEPWYNPFLAGQSGVLNRPAYVVTRLFAKLLLPRRGTLVPVRVPQATHPSAAQGDAPDRVHAAAFASDDGREGTVFLLQRDLQRALRVTFDLEPGFTVAEADLWSPERFDQDARSSEITTTRAPTRQDGRRVQVVVPPHSILALRLRR
jgi:hypothetical protein